MQNSSYLENIKYLQRQVMGLNQKLKQTKSK